MAPNNPHRNSNVIYDMLHGRKRKRSTVTERRAQEATDGHKNPSSTLVSPSSATATAAAATAAAAMVPKGGRVGDGGGHRRRRHRRHKQLAYYKKCLYENPPPQRFSNTSSSPSSSSSIGWLGAISRHRCEQNLMASRLMQLVWLANLGQNYELYTMTNSPMYRLLESHYQKLLRQKKKKKQTNEEASLLLLETSQWKIQNEQLMQDYQKEHSTKQQIAQEREFLKQNLQTYKEKYSNLKIKYLKQFKRQQAAAAKVMATNALAETPTTNKSKTKKASTSVVAATAPAAAPPNNSPESEETILPSNQQQENQAAGSAKDVVPVNSKPSAKQHPSLHKLPPPPPLSLQEYHESENLLQETNVPLYHDSPHDVYEASQITFHNGRTTTTTTTHAAMRQSQKPSIVCLPCNTTTPTTTVSASGGGDDSTNVPTGTTTTTVAKNADLKEDPKTSDAKKKRRVTLSPNVIVPKKKNPKRNVVVGGYYRGYAPNLYRPPPRPTVSAVVPDVPVSLDATTSRRQSPPPFGREDLPADTTNEEGRDSARLPPNNRETAKQPTANTSSSTTTTTAASKTITGSTRWMTNRHNRDFLMEPPSNNNTFKTSKSATVSPYVRQSIPGASSNQSTNANSATNTNTTTIRYEQVVRKKDDRDQLQRHDCPDCGQFLRAVMEGRGADVFEQHALLCDSRHRTRYTPPETPEDFWELSFMDEIKARRSTSSPTTTTTTSKEDER